MRMRAWLVIAAFSAGCGPPGIELGEFFAEAEGRYCKWAASCGEFEDAAGCGAALYFDVLYPAGLFASGQLLGSGGAVSRINVEYLRASIAAGRIAYDGEAAETCLAQMVTRGCSRPQSYAPEAAEVEGRGACAKIFSGQLADGETCVLQLECGSGGACLEDLCEDACCTGTCSVPEVAAAGASCSSGQVCAAGSACVFDEGKLDYFCSSLQGEGDACQGEDCQAGLVCDREQGLCVKQGKVGEPCYPFSDDGCLPGGLCVDPEFDGTGRCEAFKEIGETCAGGCREFAAICDFNVNKCVKAPAAGRACTGSGECAASASCDFNTMKCVGDAELGDPCGSDMTGMQVACAGDLQCDGGSLALNKCLEPGSYACDVP